MGVVTLRIIEPENDQNYSEGTTTVRLRGEQVSTGHAALFFKWYSNLATAPVSTSLDFTATLPIGSQVLILSAKDVAGESVAELHSVRHAGMAGGPPLVPPPPLYSPCLIHVMVASIQAPSDGATLSKANSLLTAEAPPQWGNGEYQASVNRLQYRWRFTPSGLPAGRGSADFMPALVFDPPGVPPNDAPGAVPRVRYQGPLPAGLGTGAYVLSLRLERIDNPVVGHEVSRNVVLTV